MDYRKKWDEIEAASTDVEMARRVSKLSQRTIIGLLRWNDRDGEYSRETSKHDAEIMLFLQAALYKTGRDYSYGQAEDILHKAGRR